MVRCLTGTVLMAAWFHAGVLGSIARGEAGVDVTARPSTDVGTEFLAMKSRLLPSLRVAAVKPPATDIQSDRSRKVSIGSAFFINRVGHLVTNYHVVNHCDQTRAVVQGNAIAATLVTSDRDQDLAILKTRANEGSFVMLNPLAEPALGRTVYIAGVAAEVDPEFVNVIRGFVSTPSPIAYNFYEVQTFSPVERGNSGGPVLDRTGKLVGVLSARVTLFGNVGLVARVSGLADLLKRNQIPFVSTDAASRTVVDVSSMARGFTVPIYCFRRTTR
ncbi:MAG: serine protease [Gammaproteobacteria bacterium]|nr:serine protease [Gammaproteobacteria bacterium]